MAEKTKNKEPYKISVSSDVLNVRTGAGMNYEIISNIRKNEIYTVVETDKNWGRIETKNGWICLDFVQIL